MSKSKKINKKKKNIFVKNAIIFFLVGVIIILGGVLIFSNTKLQPKILVSEEEWDFGKVLPDAKPVHVFTITNGGEGDLIIEGLKGSCGCIEASISTTLIPPGESAELEVIYDTTGYSGKDEKHVHIYSNDPVISDKRIDLFVEITDFKVPYKEDNN
jgi:hypothetical protein